MNIAINDTNIFIDLIKIGLLDEFFKLNFKFLTTDLVIAEFEIKEQQSAINQFISKGELTVCSFYFNELIDIQTMKNQSSNKLSFEDCSVWYLAKKKNATLLTGDNLLRKKAINDGVRVSGILFVIDCLIESNIITKHLASEKLTQLMRLNTRLPKKECETRLNLWKKA